MSAVFSELASRRETDHVDVVTSLVEVFLGLAFLLVLHLSALLGVESRVLVGSTLIDPLLLGVLQDSSSMSVEVLRYAV